jgi:hypothetical protein
MDVSQFVFLKIAVHLIAKGTAFSKSKLSKSNEKRCEERISLASES